MKTYAICVLGNSHTAALKRAWEKYAPAVAEGVSLTFFAAANAQLESLAFRDGMLVPLNSEIEAKLRLTSGGKNRIEIARYDAFILVSLGFGINVTKLCGDLGIAEHLKWGTAEHLLSRACFTAVIEAFLERCMAVQMTDRIRAISDGPVLVCPTPFLPESAARVLEMSEDPRFGNPGFLASTVALCREAAATLMARHRAEVVWQDDSTLARPGLTKPEFSINAARLNTENESPGEDERHMNENYGHLVLMRAFERLDALSGGRVLAAARADHRLRAVMA